MKLKQAMRASIWEAKRRRSSSSHSRVAKKLSHRALSYASPTEPIEGRTPASLQRLPKASEVYWLPPAFAGAGSGPNDGSPLAADAGRGPCSGCPDPARLADGSPSPNRRPGGSRHIGRGSGVFVALRRDRAATPAAGADQTGDAHQPGNPLATVPLSGGPQLGMDTRCPIGLPRADVHRLDPGQQRFIRLGAGRGRAVTQSVIAGLRQAEQACHHGNREAGLFRAHEPEEPDGITPVSRANQAVARERMSRSRR